MESDPSMARKPTKIQTNNRKGNSTMQKPIILDSYLEKSGSLSIPQMPPSKRRKLGTKVMQDSHIEMHVIDLTSDEDMVECKTKYSNVDVIDLTTDDVVDSAFYEPSYVGDDFEDKRKLQLNFSKLFNILPGVVKLLNGSEKRFIMDRISENGDEGVVYTGKGELQDKTIYISNIRKILCMGKIDNIEIDLWYSGITSLMLKEGIENKTFAFNSWSWIYVVMREYTHAKFCEDAINEKLKLQKCRKASILLFPINTTGSKHTNATPYHWTLLVLDKTKKQWTHYNSYLPLNRDEEDHFFKRSHAVKDYVEEVMRKQAEEEAGYHGLKISKDAFKYPVNNLLTSPQQARESQCCGVFVMMIMKHLILGKSIPISVSEEEVYAERARIAQLFICLGTQTTDKRTIQKLLKI